MKKKSLAILLSGLMVGRIRDESSDQSCTPAVRSRNYPVLPPVGTGAATGKESQILMGLSTQKRQGHLYPTSLPFLEHTLLPSAANVNRQIEKNCAGAESNENFSSGKWKLFNGAFMLLCLCIIIDPDK